LFKYSSILIGSPNTVLTLYQRFFKSTLDNYW
jgi:hypothetical protein